MTGQLTCPSCSASVAQSHKFCGKCGYPMQGGPPVAAQTPMPVASRVDGADAGLGKARLVLIRGEGMDGVSYHLNGIEHIAGREEGTILFPEDPYLSPRHANFVYREGNLHVRDEGSLNGVYIRIRKPTPLYDGEFFLAGEELLRVDLSDIGGDTVGGDHTHYFASPRTARPYRTTQILEGGRPGICALARNDSILIGREHCDINFPDDRFISGQHCRVDFAPHKATVTDLQSRNGTYVRVEEERELVDGDCIFLGRQLLRVELNPT